MNIPLKQFEAHIDEAIFKRGLSYFKKGQVLSFEETGPGEYEAVVGGTEDYSVKLSVRNGMLIDHRCDCPFDMGPFCKHEVAALFYLQQDELGMRVQPSEAKVSKRSSAGKRKSRTIAERVDDLLETASPKELKEFLREQAAGSASFRNLLLSSFAHHDAGESKAGYASQLKALLRSARDRQGFVNWSAASYVGRAVVNILDQAKNRLEAGNLKSAFFVSTAVLEQMVDALQYADDSNGDIGSCITAACEMLSELARRQESEEMRSLILEYCISAFDKRLYAGWDWEVDMLRIALMLVRQNADVGRLSERLDRLKGSDYRTEVAQELRYELIAKTEGDATAEKYLEVHLTNPTIRRIAIGQAFGRGQCDKARKIALDGVEFDRVRKRGLVIEWTEWLLKIAQTTGDRDLIIDYARFLLIENFNPKQDYYEVLKQQIEPESWPAYLEELIRDILAKNRFFAFEMLAGIFVREEMTDRLIALLRQSPSLDRIARYETFLAKKHAGELIELYAKGVADYLQQHTGRSHYQTACRFLRRMNKLDGRERVVQMVSSLKSAYPSRRALLEELDKV